MYLGMTVTNQNYMTKLTAGEIQGMTATIQF